MIGLEEIPDERPGAGQLKGADGGPLPIAAQGFSLALEGLVVAVAAQSDRISHGAAELTTIVARAGWPIPLLSA